MENKVNVSVDPGQHNRDYDEIIGCRVTESPFSSYLYYCDECPAALCEEFFLCKLDMYGYPLVQAIYSSSKDTESWLS